MGCTFIQWSFKQLMSWSAMKNTGCVISMTFLKLLHPEEDRTIQSISLVQHSSRKIQINIVTSKKQQDGSSCGFYSFFYLYQYACNDSVDEKYLKDSVNSSENSDMRQFCIQQYDSLFENYKSSFLKSGCVASRRENFLKYSCLVAYRANGQIVTYNERKSDQLWSYALRKENILKVKTPTSSTNFVTIPFFDAVQLIKDNQPSLDASHLDVLSVKKIDDNNCRFNIKVVQDLSLDLGDNKHLVETSKGLILNWFEPQDRVKLHQMFTMIKNNKYWYHQNEKNEL